MPTVLTPKLSCETPTLCQVTGSRTPAESELQDIPVESVPELDPQNCLALPRPAAPGLHRPGTRPSPPPALGHAHSPTPRPQHPAGPNEGARTAPAAAPASGAHETATRPKSGPGSVPAGGLGLRAIGGTAGSFPVHQEAGISYLPGDRKPPVPPHPSPPPLAHGEFVLAAAAAAATSSPSTTGCLRLPCRSAGLRHGLHRARRGGSHSSSAAQARSDRTHGARTAGRVASYNRGKFDLTSAPSH